MRNHELAAITESYRKALAVSKQLADSKVKPLSTGICFAAQLDGRGRLLENVMGEVGCLGLDYDHLSSETMGILFELIRHSPHVLIAYRTISGNGLRITGGFHLGAVVGYLVGHRLSEERVAGECLVIEWSELCA